MQVPCFENWGLIDKEHCSSLSAAICALEVSTIRLPVVNVARVLFSFVFCQMSITYLVCFNVDNITFSPKKIPFLLGLIICRQIFKS